MPNLPKPRSSTELFLAAILDGQREMTGLLRALQPAAPSKGAPVVLEEPATPSGDAARPETPAVCAGVTRTGRPCRRDPVEGSEFCPTHQGG